MTVHAHSTSPGSNPFGRPYWEDRYGAPGYTWSGNPNPVLVTEATPLAPGRALDVGSGEGGDALWLARRGWNVTAVDIATNALEKARERAESVVSAAAARIQWVQQDLTAWSPQPETYDLVSAQFMHLPQPHRSALFRSLAAAVAPGGTLLIVGHDASDLDLDPDEHGARLDELMFTADDVVTDLDGTLRIEVAESRRRQPGAGHGLTSVMRDVVVRGIAAESPLS
jgi:SAM-dependent methyltransferase